MCAAPSKDTSRGRAAPVEKASAQEVSAEICCLLAAFCLFFALSCMPFLLIESLTCACLLRSWLKRGRQPQLLCNPMVRTTYSFLLAFFG